MNCSCAWSKDLETDIPYLCVAGLDAKIKIYDVFNATIAKVPHNCTNISAFCKLIGMSGSRRPWGCKCHAISVSDQAHAKQEINDLATCPTNPALIASASDDTTVRIWSLDPADERQPCICILGGEGHSSGLLTVVGVPHSARLDGAELLMFVCS